MRELALLSLCNFVPLQRGDTKTREFLMRDGCRMKLVLQEAARFWVIPKRALANSPGNIDRLLHPCNQVVTVSDVYIGSIPEHGNQWPSSKEHAKTVSYSQQLPFYDLTGNRLAQQRLGPLTHAPPPDVGIYTTCGRINDGI